MKQEDKDLLIKDLSSRLPYGVILACAEIVGEELREMTKEGLINCDYDLDEVKPFLYPLSSMTLDQMEEYARLSYEKRRHMKETYDLVDIVHKTDHVLIRVKNKISGEEFIYGSIGYNSPMDYPDFGIDWLLKNHFDWRGLIPLGLAKNATGLGIYGK